MTSFKYLGATLCKDGTCAAEVRISHQDCLTNGSNGQTKQDLVVQHHQLCKQVQALQVSRHLYLSSTAVKHGPCLLTLRKRIQAFETKCMRKLLRISYLEHKTNDWVRSKINFLVGPQEPLLATVKRRKLSWFGACHTPRQPLQNQPSGHLGGWATPW